MEIKDITFDDGKDLFVISFEKASLYASYNLYNELNLSKGKILTDEEMEALEDFNDFNLNLSKAINFISYRIRTKKEIYDKLKNEKASKDQIDKIIDYLDLNGYIDDEAFAKSYFESKTRINKWSTNKIAYELRLKGVDNEIIENLSFEFQELDYENAKSQVLKKLPQWQRKFEGFKLKNKVYTFLSSKGFDYSVIEMVVGEIL